MTVAAFIVAIATTLLGCGDDEQALDDEDVRALVEQVLADLDLPGAPEAPMDRADIPEGELEFGFHCQIEGAGLEVDDVLVAFPPAKVWHEESAGGDIERVEVSLLAFDTAASASAVRAAYDVENTVDCLGRTFGERVLVNAADPVEAGGATAEGYAITIGSGEVQPDGHRTYAAVVGRVLVDVTVLAPGEPRGRELAQETLGAVVDALRAGGD
jgi:hypothetical protein